MKNSTGETRDLFPFPSYSFLLQSSSAVFIMNCDGHFAALEPGYLIILQLFQVTYSFCHCRRIFLLALSLCYRVFFDVLLLNLVQLYAP